MGALTFLPLVCVFCGAITAGATTAVIVGIVPILRSYPADRSVQLHLELRRVDLVLPPAALISTATAVLFLLLRGDETATAAALIGLGLVGTLAVAVVSLSLNAPLDRTIRSWGSESIPDTYAGVRRRWDRYHAVRTVAAPLALSCYIVGEPSEAGGRAGHVAPREGGTGWKGTGRRSW